MKQCTPRASEPSQAGTKGGKERANDGGVRSSTAPGHWDKPALACGEENVCWDCGSK
ncbi:hypothetical protein N657DRAFT_648965 [Parathielavia appendiculata]|uniref:Uncharacterized protein n=1 Tax=Parathielavia appendiculata TaxID=2587402 RepID=A0AAN6Z0H8_9PEZI|nr:hypothetical protein N657DRAFT_648965 [Parathielavia appendiculata]